MYNLTEMFPISLTSCLIAFKIMRDERNNMNNKSVIIIFLFLIGGMNDRFNNIN